jgi:hypothetical protein
LFIIPVTFQITANLLKDYYKAKLATQKALMEKQPLAISNDEERENDAETLIEQIKIDYS